VPDFDLERSYHRLGCRSVAGVDEVGRGALCGPVVAAAVAFPRALLEADPPEWFSRLDDSKRLRPRVRAELARLIASRAAVGLGWSISAEIDRLNIFAASHAAMRRAVAGLHPAPDMVLVDGVALRESSLPQRAVPQGDRSCGTIAAASIVAKVLRDALLEFCGGLHPDYGWDRNKGYGTAGHYRALEDFGPTPFHRRSFQLQLARKLFDERQGRSSQNSGKRRAAG